MDRLRKSLQEGAAFSNKKNLPAAAPLFSSAATAIGVAITKLKKNWAPGRSGKNVDEITSKLDEAATALNKITLLETNTVSQDKATPARTPITMVIVGGECSALSVQVEAQYFDMLNFAWPRERYTVDKAPGTKYL